MLAVDGKEVVAVVVPPSPRKPHFTGPSFVRVGSESIQASERQYEDLILSRTDKTRQLVEFRDRRTIISVRGMNYRLGSSKPFSGGGHVEQGECQVERCDGFSVTLHDLGSGASFTEELSRVSITVDDQRGRPMLMVVAPGR